VKGESTVDYRGFVKRLSLPPDFDPPRLLAYQDIRAHAITRDDVGEDVRGINASLDLIRRTRGGKWPTGPVTEEEIYPDELWHEVEFRDGTSFTFVVRDSSGGYLGCAYLYPMGVRTELTADRLDHDVDVSWWVTPDAYDRGYYPRLYHGLRQWVTNDFPFQRPYYSNATIPD
jgi:hypothetical protein